MSIETDAWMQESHPTRWALRSKPHPFRPIGQPCPEGCRSGCVCDACWQRKGDPRRRANPHRERP